MKENGISYTSGVLSAYKGDYLYPDGRDAGWDHRVLAFFVGEGRGRLVSPLARLGLPNPSRQMIILNLIPSLAMSE